MRFESNEDLKREDKAINFFIECMLEKDELFNGVIPVKLGKHELDFLIVLKNGELVIAEVKGVKYRDIDETHCPLVSVRKISTLNKYVNEQGYLYGYLIFAYESGIKYAELRDLKGSFDFSKQKKRKGSVHDQETLLRFSSTEFCTKKYIK